MKGRRYLKRTRYFLHPYVSANFTKKHNTTSEGISTTPLSTTLTQQEHQLNIKSGYQQRDIAQYRHWY